MDLTPLDQILECVVEDDQPILALEKGNSLMET